MAERPVTDVVQQRGKERNTRTVAIVLRSLMSLNHVNKPACGMIDANAVSEAGVSRSRIDQIREA